MDTSKQALSEVRSRRRWTMEEKRRITQETFLGGASVARVAQRYALNANQLFQWRKKYREGRLGSRTTATKLLPVYHIDRHVEFRRSLGYSFKTQAAWNQSPKEAADDPCRAVTCTTAKSRMRS